jgi:hypothetical protein
VDRDKLAAPIGAAAVLRLSGRRPIWVSPNDVLRENEVAVLGLIGAKIGGVIDAAGSVAGYRHGTEEPDHSAEKLTGSSAAQQRDCPTVTAGAP